jgi:hypothetical protein
MTFLVAWFSLIKIKECRPGDWYTNNIATMVLPIGQALAIKITKNCS